MGSHSVAMQLNVPGLNRSQAGGCSIYRFWKDGRLSWSYI